MSRAAFGTNAISGLNVGQAPHLIADHELTVSLNGWTDEEGTWKTADGPDVLYTGYSAISCFAAGRMGGADHCVWMDGDTLYDNGVSVGTIDAGDTMTIKSVNDGFLILGAGKVRLYDGDCVRELGTWQLDGIYDAGAALNVSGTWTATAHAISGITKASPCVVTTSAAHYLSDGDKVYITGVVGMTELNGKVYTVDNASGSTFDISIDSSDFTTYTSGGTAYENACGLDEGEYKYYWVPTIRRADDVLMLGRARGVRRYIDHPGEEDDEDTWDARTFSLSPTDRVLLSGLFYIGDFEISGTIGTDYTPGLRLYRTNVDGADAYLEKEWVHGDADFTYSSVTSLYSVASYYSTVANSDLGAVYSPDYGDHYSPQEADIADAVGQRLYLAVDDNVYWSHLDGIEFWNDLDYITVPDTVAALSPIRGMLAIMSSDRLWVMDMSSGLPDIREIDTPVGTSFPYAMVTIDAGLLFLREDGLWLFDGSSVKCISRKAFSSLSEPKSICATGDTIYMSGESYSYVVRVRDGGWVWHGGDGTYELSDATGGHIYAASTTTVSKLFEGGPVGGILTTKLFGGFDESKAYRVVLDVEGESRPTVSINGVRQSDIAPHGEAFPVTTTGRRIIRFPVPRLSNPYFTMTVATSGDLKVHGFIVEAC